MQALCGPMGLVDGLPGGDAPSRGTKAKRTNGTACRNRTPKASLCQAVWLPAQDGAGKGGSGRGAKGMVIGDEDVRLIGPESCCQ